MQGRDTKIIQAMHGCTRIVFAGTGVSKRDDAWDLRGQTPSSSSLISTTIHRQWGICGVRMVERCFDAAEVDRAWFGLV
jgi:hypothetical protein